MSVTYFSPRDRFDFSKDTLDLGNPLKWDQYRRQAAGVNGRHLWCYRFEQHGDRYSDYRRTAKAASRFWRGSTKGAASTVPEYRHSDTAG